MRRAKNMFVISFSYDKKLFCTLVSRRVTRRLIAVSQPLLTLTKFCEAVTRSLAKAGFSQKSSLSKSVLAKSQIKNQRKKPQRKSNQKNQKKAKKPRRGQKPCRSSRITRGSLGRYARRSCLVSSSRRCR